jgi:hypothetical protein
MANDKLKRYALVAEIVSAAAVVITLVFLAFQVKDNTAAVRASTYDDILSDHIEWRMTIASSPDLLTAFVKDFNSDTNMSDVERQGQQFALQAVWQIFERAYFARKYETLGDSEWERYERAICGFTFSTDVEAELGSYLTVEFVDFAKSCGLSNDR